MSELKKRMSVKQWMADKIGGAAKAQPPVNQKGQVQTVGQAAQAIKKRKEEEARQLKEMGL